MKIDCLQNRFGLLPIAVVLAMCFPLGLMGGEINETQAEAGVYYVDQGRSEASDGNPGTSQSLPWQTVKKANNTLKAGDTVVITAGTYEEEISPQNSGAAKAPITYVAKAGDRPVVRHVIFLKKEYIRIIGIEITQNSKAYRNAVEIYGSHHCEILNNYIHHTVGQGIRNNAYYGHSNYNIIRGNTSAASRALCRDYLVIGDWSPLGVAPS